MTETKKHKKGRIFLLICLLVFLTVEMQVKAGEMDSTVIGTLQQLTENTDLKELPDAASNTLEQLKEGEAVILESSDEKWSKVIYQGTEGYVVNTALGIYSSVETEELEQEFQEVNEENIRTAEEYELKEESRHSTAIWGIVITLLVAAVFGAGIITALKKNKEEE